MPGYDVVFLDHAQPVQISFTTEKEIASDHRLDLKEFSVLYHGMRACVIRNCDDEASIPANYLRIRNSIFDSKSNDPQDILTWNIATLFTLETIPVAKLRAKLAEQRQNLEDQVQFPLTEKVE